MSPLSRTSLSPPLHPSRSPQGTAELFLTLVPSQVFLLTQLCPTLCNPMDCSLSSSSFLGILQARKLEWVAMPSSRGSS